MNEATRNQIAAAAPERSTWLSANAGSGKTRVLTDRVARLLLSGTPPQNILCLTFTKAAAGEMQNRLFRRLGEWAMMEDGRLAGDLAGIGVPGEIGARELARARKLFASAIETPGGLKIQTIHSFCATILRQFPMEAGVSPGFREIDERESRLMRAEVFDRMAEGPEAEVLAEFARFCSAERLDDLLDEVVGHAGAFEQPAADDEIRGWFGLAPGDDPIRIVARGLDAGLRDAVAAITEALTSGSAPNKRDSGILTALLEAGHDEAFAGLCKIFITQKNTLTAYVAKALAKLAPELGPDAEAVASTLAQTRNLLVALEEAERTLALHHFGRAYVAAYAERKARAGVLDFDDLIRRTLRLLSDSATAQWVLYRLDGGIDHILVDEAQDTSPDQWRIIELISQEFPSGEGARAVRRTIFAVGDHKQSIYSFQGADPAEFERMKNQFSARMTAAPLPLQDLQLQHSFRSSPLLLGLVDKVFDGNRTSGVAEPTEHIAFREALPGRVDLWPLMGEDEDEPYPPWHDASERTVPRIASLRLADRIAAEVARMIAEEQVPDKDGTMQPVKPGDVLILVRRRSFISVPLVLALKKAGVPVAGADQIALASELAAMDVVAVLKVLVTPADSLSLAAALRSPIFGLSEAELYRLARGRDDGATLWQALEAARDQHPQAVAILEDLRRQMDFLRPFELISRLLVRHGARARLLARLGEEVAEALDVLLQQALAYETTEVPSFTGFLTWHEAAGEAVKRQAEGAGETVRVMTVHGAKGLESPIVILPDTADLKRRERASTLALPGGQPVFRSRAERVPEALGSVYAEERRKSEEEANRLLYVALTRAKSWLIVCGAGKDEADDDKLPCWHRLVGEALGLLAPAEAQLAGEPGLRAELGEWPSPSPRDTARQATAPTTPLPAWASLPGEPGPELPQFFAPSRLAAGTLAQGRDADRDAALRHGSELHLLLEHLPLHPRADWPALAEALLRQGEVPALAAEIAERLAEAEAVLGAPDLGWIFGPDSLAEVEIAAEVPEIGRRILGRIDRLVRHEGRIVAVDFKSGAEVPGAAGQVEPSIRAQLGAYVSALRQIFPHDEIAAAVLWTRPARLMEIPNEMLLESLRGATTY